MDSPSHSFEKLGRLTLILLIMKRLGAFLIFALLTIALYVGSSYIPAQFSTLIPKALQILITIDLVFLLLGLLIGYLEYTHYGVIADEEGVTITRGLLTTEELAVPYRRIKEVKQDRGINDQMFGSSTLVMTVLGGDEGGGGESEIILPSLSKNFAEFIQKKTMNQAEFEKIDVDEPRTPAPGPT